MTRREEDTVEKIWIYQMGQIIHCPEGYIFKDENGNVINATKIILEKKNNESREDWIKINRDSWGFLANGMMEQMYNSLPIIIWDSKYEMTEFIDKHNWGDWLSDLEGKPYYSHYLPIVLPKKETL